MCINGFLTKERISSFVYLGYAKTVTTPPYSFSTDIILLHDFSKGIILLLLLSLIASFPIGSGIIEHSFNIRESHKGFISHLNSFD